jgi:CubicO group peptidase (beta-lactamase class C family)
MAPPPSARRPMKVDADAAGLDATRLERVSEHLKTRYVDAGRINGCQVVVARHGAIGYFRSFGLMDREREKPVTDATIWRIFSMTKPITGVALMSLYERGLFQLHDPVARFIPAWKDLKVREKHADGTTSLAEPHRPMTVRDAMMHMTGIGWGGRRAPFGVATEATAATGETTWAAAAAGVRNPLDADWTLEGMVDALAERPLRFHPGEHWFYSLSTDVCARLVEVISGRRFDDYLREQIFEPLGMVDTGFTVPDSDIDRFAANYGRARDKSLRLVDDPETSGYRTPRRFLSGGGGLVSTTADYVRFGQMLLNGGELDGVRILGRKTVELMTRNHLPGNGQLRDYAVPGAYGEVGFDGTGFGLTMAVSLGPVATQTIGSAGEFMWGGAASTTFWVDPSEDLVVVFMTQLMPSGTFNFRGQLKTLVYPAIVD